MNNLHTHSPTLSFSHPHRTNKIGRWAATLFFLTQIIFFVTAMDVFALDPFQESAGQVVMEAENFETRIPRGGKDWTFLATTPGFSGSGYLEALPNTGQGTQNSGYDLFSPELQYLVYITTPGTYYVWVRGSAPSINDDSLHTGVDGTTPSTADRISSSVFLSGFNWARDTLDGSPARFTISNPGIHLIHLWMREDGFRIDKLLLTTSTSATPPSGFGPSESPRVAISDATPPTTPGRPREGSSSDLDYDGDGIYSIYWTLASDSESAVVAYEVQERVGPAGGIWTTLTTTATTGAFSVSGRQHNTHYFYRVRAKNGVGLWGAWSEESDGILVDKTAPSAVIVTDDGAITSVTTALHATWTTSSDPESGIVRYEYQIRRDSTAGTIIVNWTSVGLATEVTRTGLTLTVGTTYYFGVRARNGAGLYSSVRYSDGIRVQSGNTPPAVTLITPSTGSKYYEQDAATVTVSASDSDGDILEYQFTVDGVVKQPWGVSSSYAVASSDRNYGKKTIGVDVRDNRGGTAAASAVVFFLKKPLEP